MIKDLGTKIAEGIDKFYKAFQKQKVLKTMEEVEANTNEENIPSALLLSALNNKLGNCSLEQSGNDFFIVGADAVRKKLGSGDMDITITCVHSVHLHNSSYKLDIDVPLSRSTYIIAVRDGRATFSGGYASNVFSGYAAVPGSDNTITINATSVTVDVRPL